MAAKKIAKKKLGKVTRKTSKSSAPKMAKRKTAAKRKSPAKKSD